jgi:hypothetical protein
LNWKLKANIQRVCAALPASETIYYLLQSNLGVFRKAPDPMENMRAAGVMLHEIPFRLEGKRVLEVGTGRRLDMPVAFYLAGAASVDTVDLHPYLRPELVMGSIGNMIVQRAEIAKLLAPHADAAGIEGRFDKLAGAKTVEDVLKVTDIRYHSPGDARKTSLAAGSIDLQFSYTVFEHIPGDVLRDILIEAGRVLNPETGVACNQIDLSDHFFQVDPDITQVNFLRYSDGEWSKYNDNQFAYHNRLRKPDYEKIYRDAGHEALSWIDFVDQRSVDAIENGFPLHDRYKGLDPKMLATTVIRVVSRAKAK